MHYNTLPLGMEGVAQQAPATIHYAFPHIQGDVVGTASVRGKLPENAAQIFPPRFIPSRYRYHSGET